MKILIDTDNKTIEIIQATSEELIAIGKKYAGYLIETNNHTAPYAPNGSDGTFVPYIPYAPYISYIPATIQPYYHTEVTCTITP